MLKLGLMHAMLIDMTEELPACKRRPRVSDELLMALAPYDFGRGAIRLLQLMGILDTVQRDWVGRLK